MHHVIPRRTLTRTMEIPHNRKTHSLPTRFPVVILGIANPGRPVCADYEARFVSEVI
jgi:hypothetical protein